MSAHVPDELLYDFVDGDVGEQLAIHIASHLDACASCAARAHNADPLAIAFASMDDPEVPDDLVAAVLAAAERPGRAPWTEVAVGSSMLAAAAILTLWLEDPVAVWGRIGTVLTAFGSGAEHLLGESVLLGLVASSVAFTLFTLAAVATAVPRLALLERSSR